MNVAARLYQHATQRPEAIAIVDTYQGRPRETTYRELAFQTQRVVQLLQNSALRAGDTVLVLVPMSAELYAILIALFEQKLVAMFVDPGVGLGHLNRCCRRCPPQAMIGVPKAHTLRVVSREVRRIPLHFSVGNWPVPATAGRFRWEPRLQPPTLPALESIVGTTPALLTFTSGSTGEPKAIQRTHEFLLIQSDLLEEHLCLAPDTYDLTTLPIVLLANLAVGATSVIPNVDLRRPGFVDGRKLLDTLDQYPIQSATASPAFFRCLVEAAEQANKTYPQFKTLFSGGAPVFPSLCDRLQTICPQATVAAVYGSTEAEPIAKLVWSEVTEAQRQQMQSGGGLLAGTPVEQIQVRILQDRWGESLLQLSPKELDSLTQPNDSPGEIIVSGPQVVRGYWQGQGDEETKLHVGNTVWHRTGDAGYFDAERQLWLLGRCSAKIADAHGTIYPFAVETAVDSLREIRRSALVSWQQQRVLVYELRNPPANQQEWEQQLAQRLAWAKVDRFFSWQSIPVDARHNAKIDYPSLHKRLAKELGPM